MKTEKRLKLYTLGRDVWLPDDAEILDLALKGKLLQLVVWEDAVEKIRFKRRFEWAVINEMCLLLDKHEAFYVGRIFDPELDEMVYVFELVENT